MAFCSDAAMVLFYDIDGDVADHDAWHSREHFRERLGVPGFLRASRWVSAGAPRYMVLYEVSHVGVATSEAYLARLNNPTPWTTAMMPRFRGMIRGFGRVVARQGFGFGSTALAMTFRTGSEQDDAAMVGFADQLTTELRSCDGIVSTVVLRPEGPPPMTREQALRGPDTHLPWVLIATGYDGAALERFAVRHFTEESLAVIGAEVHRTPALYALHQIADERETVGGHARSV